MNAGYCEYSRDEGNRTEWWQILISYNKVRQSWLNIDHGFPRFLTIRIDRIQIRPYDFVRLGSSDPTATAVQKRRLIRLIYKLEIKYD